MSPIEIFGSQLIGLESDDAASRAEALDVRIAVGGELFDGGVKRGLHPCYFQSRRRISMPSMS